MSSPLHVVYAGQGPRLLFLHGSAADATTWSIQLAGSLREWFELVAYDRPLDRPTVAAHAADAATLLSAQAPGVVIGSSFGAVVALELIRTRPQLVRGAILIEPPMPASDDLAGAATAFLAEFDRRAADQGGPAAAEFFLRFVLGDDVYDRIPRAFQERSKEKWQQIRADSEALLAYRPRYKEMASIKTPVLLVGGDRSATYFRATLDAMLAALPNAKLEIVHGAGHMLHAEASRRFAQLVEAFAVDVGIR